MTGGRMGAEGDPTTIIVYADVYTQGTPSTSEHELSVIMSSSEDPSSLAQTSIATTGFDVLDDARLAKINMTPVTSQPTKPVVSPTLNTDADAIEEAVPIVKTTLPKPELELKIEKNGIEKKTKQSPNEPNDDCLINCIYYSQQCCDCTIV
ncbi:uncharacterized protein LOC112459097 isoform X2 [Temnothorax curvispinosus]|uniref:Uncharacterized protein LOC112459097 isoform X2 n=1 Tax=Temnothorax curvispinosus TaxID=300111 RepID=A0A6J1QAU3_9HYME|nr:uncharacterized protein LOC112459097 isoform X2 [Temnothorax curvispinosus]